MNTYYVTFGQKYNEEPHPELWGIPGLPDHVGTIQATDYWDARDIVYDLIGEAYCSVYETLEELQPEHYKAFFNLIDFLR